MFDFTIDPMTENCLLNNYLFKNCFVIVLSLQINIKKSGIVQFRRIYYMDNDVFECATKHIQSDDYKIMECIYMDKIKMPSKRANQRSK